MKKYILSKSTFIRGLQCEKSLYLYKHHFDLRDELPNKRKSILENGTEIGVLAQGLFKNGVDASPSDFRKIYESVERTKELIEQGETVIYEATFIFDEILVALDILVKEGDAWKAYEVKSSTSVSKTYIKDAAIQFYTIANSGLNLTDISIVFINNQYHLDGEMDIEQFFRIESVKDKVDDYLPNIPAEVKRLKSIVALEAIPDIAIGEHCSTPYDCDFKSTCWKHIPENSVFDVARLGTKKKFECYDNGIISFEQLKAAGVKLSKNQQFQIKSTLDGDKKVDKKALSQFLSALNYPLSFLDFETVFPAIPVYQQTKPYQQVVFQYSIHQLKSKTSALSHSAFLADPQKDQRIDFIEQLIKDCGNTGDILVYNITFEQSRLEELAVFYPKRQKEIKQIISRLKDLMIPFQKNWYYVKEMKGMYSIKYVLPALVPDLTYQDLEIKEGGTASKTYLSMVNGTFEGDAEATKQALLDYCNLDTFAMVKIVEKLEAEVEEAVG